MGHTCKCNNYCRPATAHYILLILGGKSSKSASATTSPIKDTIRGSQEMIKKLMSSKDRSGLSSSSSEKVCIFGHFRHFFS